jgi:ketose-bisphosphate aldolase
MSYVNVNDLLHNAIERNYCVGYFESWDLDSTLAVVRAAEKLRSPVIIGFCGEYLSNPQRAFPEDLFLYGKILREIAHKASVPVATLLNESNNFSYTLRSLAAGFDMVMFVDDEMPAQQFASAQRKLVEFAHACGIAVEAEIGALPTANHSTGVQQGGCNTDPELAAQFVKDTGIDALAVAVGNIHLLEGAKADLDLNLLAKIRQKVNIPLVLHGGTGIDKAIFKEAIKCGVAKVNIGTGLKRAAINAYKDSLSRHDIDKVNPNSILGNGSNTDIQRCVHDAVFERVIEFIHAFNGENKARLC